VNTGPSFTPRERHLGRILRVVAANHDAVLGEVRPPIPQIIAVNIIARKWVVGETVAISVTHKYVDSDKLEVVWARCGNHFRKVIAVNTPDYVIKPDDTDFSLMVIATAGGDPVCSAKSPPIIPNDLLAPTLTGTFTEGEPVEFKCSLEVESVQWYCGGRPLSTQRAFKPGNKEVGWQLRADLKLASSGIVVTAVSPCAIKPCLPSAELFFDQKTVTVGEVIRPVVSYSGGREGASTVVWERESAGGWETICERLQYETTGKDVGHILRVSYTPIRADGRVGPATRLEIGPVEHQGPRVSAVSISQDSDCRLTVTRQYSGGREGLSLVIWRVYPEGDGPPSHYAKTAQLSFEPPAELIGRTVDCLYVPMRSDGQAGKPCPSSNRIKVRSRPTVVSGQLLAQWGRLVVGGAVCCRVEVSRGATPVYEWERGDGKRWERIRDAEAAEFTPTEAEKNMMLRCAVTAVTRDGLRSAVLLCGTEIPVGASIEPFSIVCDGPPVTGAVLTVNRPSEILWQSGRPGAWTDIATGAHFTVTACEVGLRLRAVGKDSFTEPTPVVELAPSVRPHVLAAIKAGKFSFRAAGKVEGSWVITCRKNDLKMRSGGGIVKTVKWGSVKCECGEPGEMILVLDAGSKFPLVPSFEQDQRAEAMIGPAHVRDYVAAVVRGFAQRAQAGDHPEEKSR
jgi:hypothetical protein